MAEFRIDQATPGAGIPGQSRHDLIAGEVITLVATAPLGASYAWTLVDKVGTVALPDTGVGSTVVLGPAPDIVAPCGFLMKLTATLGGVVTTTRRIISVRSEATGMRPILFSETARAEDTYFSNSPSNSVDNATYPNLSGLGLEEDNWRGWAEWAWELERYLALSGGLRLTARKTGAYSAKVGDLVLYDAGGGAFQINAPSVYEEGSTFGLKEVGESLTAITINGSGADIEDPTTNSFVGSFSFGAKLASLTYRFTSTISEAGNWVLV